MEFNVADRFLLTKQFILQMILFCVKYDQGTGANDQTAEAYEPLHETQPW